MEEGSLFTLTSAQLFNPVKKNLQVAGIRYAMHFPATLSVEYKGSKMSFQLLTKAQAFLKDLEVDSGESLWN